MNLPFILISQFSRYYAQLHSLVALCFVS